MTTTSEVIVSQLREIVLKKLTRAAAGLRRRHWSSNSATGPDRGRAPLAALCYVGDSSNPFHTISQQQRQISTLLSDLGFAVDLYHCDKLVGLPRRDYDIVLGFGGSWRLLCRRNPSAIKILYCTEAPAFVTYINEMLAIRLAASGRPSITRSYRYYSDEDYVKADYYFQMGQLNVELLQSVLACDPRRVHFISTYGLGFDTHQIQKKTKANTFIWFGSAGAALKGLQLSIEAARHRPGIELLVAGCTENEFESCRSRPGNVRFLGRIEVPSPIFLDIMAKVGFLLLPTGAEGISTAVITCMYQGVVPITTRQANIKDGCIVLEAADLPSILRSIDFVTELNDEDFQARSTKASQIARTLYSPKQFRKSFEDALNEVLRPRTIEGSI